MRPATITKRSGKPSVARRKTPGWLTGERDARTLMNRIKAAHKARFTKQMRKYFGVRVDLLRDTPINLQTRW